MGAAEKIITEVSLDRPPSESLYPRLTLAEIKVARGDYPQARELLASIENVEHGEDPRFLGPLHAIRAELALARGRSRAGRRRGGTRRGGASRTGENALELLRLCAVGMRCAADRASRPEASEQDRRAAMAVGDQLARVAQGAGPEPPTAETAQLVALCGAERQRIRGEDTDAVWDEVAIGWADLDRPYPATYARRRQAEAAYARGDLDTGPATRSAKHTGRRRRSAPSR